MITQQPITIPIVDNKGVMTPQFFSWHVDVTKLQIISGTGSPEGLIQAQPTALYMDVTGSTGSILYIKQLAAIAGDRRAGWVPV